MGSGAGLVPGGGPMARLPRLIGRGRAWKCCSGQTTSTATWRSGTATSTARSPTPNWTRSLTPSREDCVVRQAGDRRDEAPGQPEQSAPTTEIAPVGMRSSPRCGGPAAQARIRTLFERDSTNPETWRAGSATTWAHSVTDDVQTRRLFCCPRTALTLPGAANEKEQAYGARTQSPHQFVSGVDMDRASRRSSRISKPTLVRIHRVRAGSGEAKWWQSAIHPNDLTLVLEHWRRCLCPGRPARWKHA